MHIFGQASAEGTFSTSERSPVISEIYSVDSVVICGSIDKYWCAGRFHSNSIRLVDVLDSLCFGILQM